MLYTAFIFGLISSFHCIGMCGPIAMMLPVDRTNHTKKATQIITYHLGRLTTYASIGFVFGLLGKGFFMAGLQQNLSIFIGVAMIVIVVTPAKIFAKYNFSKPVFKINALTTTMNTTRTKSEPCLSARRVPNRLPATLATAMVSAKCHQTWPL